MGLGALCNCVRPLLCFALMLPHLAAASFDAQFEAIKKHATRPQLYALLYDLPKGGDLHHHLGLSFMAEQWYAAATDPKRNRGNEFYTRIRFNSCPDSSEPLLRFRNIRRSTYQTMSDCRKSEYEKLAALSPELKQQWLSSLRLDGPQEGRNEFFEAIAPRLTELARDPWLTTELLVESMQHYAAQGLRYLETQTSTGAYMDQDGKAVAPNRAAQIFRDALDRPEAKATGVTVRFQATIIRFAPDAEQQLERAYDFVDANRDLWVAVNMAGREDNDKNDQPT